MESFDPSLTTLLVLVLVAMVAGFVDTLVGGGGLITIPSLLAAGLPPIFALGTNKLQAVAGSGTASISLFLYKKVKFQQVKWLMLSAFVGSLLGSVIVQYFDAAVLTLAIPLVITLIAVYFLLAPNASLVEREPRISSKKYGVSAVPAIGFYDGMFGPGTGSFFVWAGVSLRGQAIVNSTMLAKSLNFATNLASLIVFIGFGKVVWLIGGAMMIGQFVGASLGARSLMTINPALLRYMVIAICFVILVWWATR